MISISGANPVIVHHAGGGDGLVQSLQAGPSLQAGMVASSSTSSTSPASSDCLHSLLLAVSSRHAGTSLSAGPLPVVSLIFEVLVLSPAPGSPPSVWGVNNPATLLSAVHDQRGAGGGESGLH